MSDLKMFPPCRHCSHIDWCTRHGCTLFNDKSRNKLREWERIQRELEEQYGVQEP